MKKLAIAALLVCSFPASAIVVNTNNLLVAEKIDAAYVTRLAGVDTFCTNLQRRVKKNMVDGRGEGGYNYSSTVGNQSAASAKKVCLELFRESDVFMVQPGKKK